MKCQELQFDISLFSDDILSEEEQDAVRHHLPACPLCRQKLEEYQMLRNDLRSLARPEIPHSLVNSIRASVSQALSIPGSAPTFGQLEPTRRWREIWLVPSTIGGLATLLIGFALFSAMLTAAVEPSSASLPTGTGTKTSVYLARVDGDILTPSNYARSRMSVSGESPSINPQGALIALTRSLVRGEMKDDEVVVVADVFGNGLAQIAEVVEPSHNAKAVEELQRALESDAAYAPFVPAVLDNRGDPVRVVFKIQSVNVKTGNPPRTR